MQAKPYGRIDYSHSKNRLMKIAHDNQLLVGHLTVISKAVSSRSTTHHQHTPCAQSVTYFDTAHLAAASTPC